VAEEQAARGSGAPDRGESGRVEAVEAAPAGADDDVIEDGLDDLGLLGQRQVSPAFAQARRVCQCGACPSILPPESCARTVGGNVLASHRLSHGIVRALLVEEVDVATLGDRGRLVAHELRQDC
jgi:hypothetical protein